MNRLNGRPLKNLALILAAGILCSCSKKKAGPLTLSQLYPAAASPKITAAAPEAKEEPSRYFYPYGNKRDPFIPLIGATGMASSGEGKGLGKGDLANLELKGILHDHRGKMAVIASGGGEHYVLRAGRIYDRKNRVVTGVSGIIKEKSVILISQNRTMTELSLRTREEGGISVTPPSRQGYTGPSSQ